ncbi:hypothetical protein TG4357_01868 [Thalassovita gelatinovora]|uniref:Uncharacterized protein n=1 Tax=Thalassovita gelatinovora TaxID=53501 RepID=A0A0P1FB62_THAGE|nr:hypothetical protein [Thalassovita gelatinovora]QIZ80052.1 hypothetical protein HFZ77_05955 [Thalassovita gelatinovora]CUH65447.1 hypothetical protein TG4357_01868 [Thalassovita gelatinovora]SER09505.1 hypothetical protein SAMN04488043_11582 [Thalassovita gelatinovora]
MTFPEWTKPGVYGALVGAVAVSILGFTWGGWTTSGDAQEMADSFAAEQVILAMVPVCLELSEADAERTAKLAILQEASSFQRRNAMMETGWATLPGTDAPSRDLANACLEGLELDGS